MSHILTADMCHAFSNQSFEVPNISLTEEAVNCWNMCFKNPLVDDFHNIPKEDTTQPGKGLYVWYIVKVKKYVVAQGRAFEQI